MLDYGKSENLASDKHSSLLGAFVSYEETKVFMNAAPGTVFTTLHFLGNSQMGPIIWNVRLH